MSEGSGPLELGRWLAGGWNGAVRLRWREGELTLRLFNGQVVGLEGLDPARLARALAAELGVAEAEIDLGEGTDVLSEASRLAVGVEVPETRALAVVKVFLEPGLRAWMTDPDAAIATFEGEVEPPTGPAISLPHVLVETVLADEDPAVVDAVLLDRDVLLRRAQGFLERYAALQLAEEAALIAAKVTGQRTASEIVSRSPQPPQEVERLLAALVVAGLVEIVPVARPVAEAQLIGEPVAAEDEPRRLPWRWIGIGLAGAILVVVVLILIVRGGDPAESRGSGRWGVVVDMGCEAVQYERMLRKVDRYDDKLRAVKVAEGEEVESPCWRLIWGEYASEAEAAGALSSLPGTLIAEGFEPHVVELETGSGSAGNAP